MNEKKLEAEILRHKKLYYAGNPEISDEDFDELEEKLREIRPTSYVFKTVGAPVNSSLEKVSHKRRMLSLEKVYDIDSLEKWKKNYELVGVQKYDGTSLSLIYEKGKLKLAKTRGNGRVGENVTEKVLWVNSVPKRVELEKPFEIRGEIFCSVGNFRKLSLKMEELGLDKPTSIRNIVPGLLGRKDFTFLSEYLSFVGFELIEENDLKTEEEKLQEIKKRGIKTPDFRVYSNLKDIEKYLLEVEDFLSNGMSKDSGYQIDGAVFTINDLSVHSELGETAHHPKYKMAYKFKSLESRTIIKEILWQISRNGILTPVAKVEPTFLSGAEIQRVTLHNYGVVREHKLKPGDEIWITRSGEVIPKFERTGKRSKAKYVVPKNCPYCGDEIFEEEIRLFCRNKNCPGINLYRILDFVQKIGIEDLSEKRILQFLESGIIGSIPDLYDIKKDELLKLEKIKEKLANKILSSIEGSKTTELLTFITALGIEGGGRNKCERIITAGYNDINKVLKLEKENLLEIDGFAEKSSDRFLNSLSEKKEMILKLISSGFVFEKVERRDGVFSDKKFCITGKLEKPRTYLKKLIEENGGKFLSSVTKDLDYLVSGDPNSNSAKLKNARKNGTKIISEKKFFEMVEK